MQAYTVAITAPASTGGSSVVISGIADETGAPFDPKLVIVHGSSSALNAIGNPTWVVNYGVDDFAHHQGYGSSDVSQFGLKIAGVGVSGDYSCVRYQASAFFGGVNLRLAYFSAHALGQATLTYVTNDLPSDVFIATFLGGSELDVISGFQTLNPQTGLGFLPVALSRLLGVVESGTGTGLGATTDNVGVTTGATHQAGMAASVAQFSLGGGNERSQTITALTPSGPTLTSFDADGFTASSALGAYWAVGGCHAASGVLTQPTGVGVQEIVTGIKNKVVFLLSYGAAASGSALTDFASWSLGVMDGTRQYTHWSGESSTTATLTGATTVIDNRVLVFGTPNGVSTTFAAEAAAGGFSVTNSSFLLNWQLVDGVQRQVLWFALGDAAEPAPPPPPPPTCEPTVLRRLRRSPHVNLERLRLFCQRFEVDLQRGRGIAGSPSLAPTITLRVSTDGGQTWSSDIPMSTGAAGDFRARSYAVQLGSSDDFVFELSVSDEVVPWAIAAAYGDFVKGMS